MSVNREGMVPVEKLEALAKDIGPDLGMFIAQWAAQQQLGVEQEALSTLVVRRVRAKLRALISSAREEGEPSGCTCPDGYPSSNECPLHGDEVHRDPPSSASTHLCPNKHGAEHEMELVWYCETCGKREPVDKRCCYHGEGDVPTVCPCVEKYIKDHTATAGAEEEGPQDIVGCPRCGQLLSIPELRPPLNEAKAEAREPGLREELIKELSPNRIDSYLDNIEWRKDAPLILREGIRGHIYHFARTILEDLLACDFNGNPMQSARTPPQKRQGDAL